LLRVVPEIKIHSQGSCIYFNHYQGDRYKYIRYIAVDLFQSRFEGKDHRKNQNLIYGDKLSYRFSARNHD